MIAKKGALAGRFDVNTIDTLDIGGSRSEVSVGLSCELSNHDVDGYLLYRLLSCRTIFCVTVSTSKVCSKLILSCRTEANLVSEF